jgi:thiamine biosynthesis lipoprotein ApbE
MKFKELKDRFTYNEESETARINRFAGIEPVVVSEETFDY